MKLHKRNKSREPIAAPSARSDDGALRTRDGSPRDRERGVALMAVIIAIAITIVISGEFGNATTTDISAAANYRDQMRAHFLARSAQNITELLIRVQGRLDNMEQLSGLVDITDPMITGQIMGPFCGGSEELSALLGAAASETKGFGAEVGTCGLEEISTEDDKINLNCANNATAFPIIKSAMDALVYFQAYDPVFEEADAEGWRRDRAQQVSAILDYVDSDTMKLKDRGTNEDYGYENLRDKYLPKNNYIDTLGEVKLARGVDDRFWTLFGSAFTAYGGCKINIASVKNPQLIAAILYLSAKNPNDPVLMDPRKLFALAGIIAKGKQFGETFSKLDDFVNFVKDPTASVAALAATGGMAGSAATNALSQGLMPGEKVGLELDPKKLGTIAMAGPRRTYRVQVYGEIARKQTDNEGRAVYPPVRSSITGVWDTKVIPQNVRKQPVPKGSWVFLRED
jgi:general secretion pathway protein K